MCGVFCIGVLVFFLGQAPPSSHEVMLMLFLVYLLSESHVLVSSQIFLSLAVTRLSGALATAA
jgi:hypothetical protein